MRGRLGLAAHIKTHKNYTTAIGKDLGLIGAVIVIDPVNWKPIISVQFQAGHPIFNGLKVKSLSLKYGWIVIIRKVLCL